MKGLRTSVDRLIADLAGHQRGVISREQLLALGLGAGAIAHRVRLGRLHVIHRGVYAVGHARLSIKARWMAGVLACGEGAVLSHVSAAALWGLQTPGVETIHVTVRTRGGHRPPAGVRIHRTRRLAASEVTSVDAIPVSTVARTLLDLAEDLTARRLQNTVERTLVLQVFDLGAIQAVLDANPGRRGASTLTAIIASLSDEPAPTRSELERRFLAMCRAHVIPLPAVNAPVLGYTVDFLWRSHKLIVETDGRRHHATPQAFERDRARDAELTVAGYRVVRVTYRQLHDDPAAVARMLLALLGSAVV